APSTCSDACEIRFDLLDFTCNDNGTLTDPSDDFYEVTINASAINPGAANTFEVFADNVSQGVFTYGTGGQITLPANGTIVNIRIADTEVNGCEAQQSIGPLDPCDEDCSISASVSNIVCDDNGTDTDPSDDTFTFDLIVNGQNTGAGWQAIGGAISGNYGSTQTFGPYPIAGGSLNFDLEDLTTPGCIASINVAAPSTCSDACEIRFDLLDFTCNDNGTLTDPSDDFYEISINASAINPGAANTFEVFADNVSQGVFTYGTGGQITLPANGTIVNIRIADTEVNGCEAQQSIGPLDPCDEDCSISASVSNIVCDDNGTDTDPSDDTFTFDLIVNGQNTGAGWQAIGGAINGNYGNTQTFGPYPIAGGALNFDLEDLTTPGCIASINVAAPSTCSDACEIRFDLLDFTCNDNGTLTDPSDDFYEVTINASAINPGAANTFEVFADNVSQGVFTYGTGGQITLPANGTIVNIRIADTEVNGCEAQQSIGPLDPCDEDCSISASVSNIVCDDNGTGNDASDDTFTFELLVIGQNTGGGWSASNGISGGYGSPQTYGPYLIADGPLSFSIEDDVTATCITTVNVTPPAACSSCNQSIEAGPSQVLTCTNTNIQLNATSSEVGNYSWAGPNAFSDNSLNPIVVDSGWYVLTVTYPDACVAQDSVFIDMDQETPMANAGPDQFLSCDVDTVVLDASLSSLGPDLNYVWTNSIGDTIAENISVAVGTPGNYFLQVTNISNGCSSTQDEITIIDSTAIPTAIIYADPDNVLDCQVGSILLSSDDQENVVFLWNSVVAPQITVSQAGTVTLIAIDTITGCQNTDQIIIDDLSDFPFVNLQPAAPISCFTPEIVLDATGSQMGPNLIYNWYDGMNNLIVEQGSDTLRITEGGMYVFQVVDTLNGCENSDTIIIENLAENPPLAIIDQIGALNCYNPTQVLDATGSTPFGNLSFSWTSTNGNILSGANTPTPEIDAPGAYVLEVFDVISGCTQLDTVNIDQDFNEPTVQIEPTTSITCLQPEITLDASNSTATGNLSFTWNATPTGAIIAGDTTLNPLINQGGTFNLTIINLDNGCTNAASISVDQDTELPLAQAAVEDELDCLTLEVLLNGDGSSEGSIYTYRWEGPGLIDGSNGLRPTVNLPGNYQLTVRNTDNGCEAIDEIEVIENVDVPQGLEVVVIPPICQGDPGSIEILAVDGGQGPYFYSINGGQTFFDLNVFDVLEPGNYAVRVQDAAGCEYEELFNMPDVPAVAISLSPELIVNLGEDGQINATVNLLDSEIDTIIWTPTTNLSCINCLNPRIIRPLEEELYEIRVRDLKGCEDAAQIQLRLTKKRDVYIPNAFTPGDDDGLNDEFMIFANLETISRVNSFQVFDRWGELVFEDANFQPNDPTHSWDGTLRGEPMNPAVFVYWAEIEFIDGEVRLYKGDVTLIR
ncbi:MAG: gliding motility-associated C-terminal domain-containing protein, partial [Bacteroidota bacterium]